MPKAEKVKAEAALEVLDLMKMVSYTFTCAALPANLIESELFGHEKGASKRETGSDPGR